MGLHSILQHLHPQGPTEDAVDFSSAFNTHHPRSPLTKLTQLHSRPPPDLPPSVGPEGERLDLDLDEDPEDGDSFFDDLLPKPQKTYGWKVEASGARGGPAGSLSEAPGGGSSASEQSHSRKGAPASREKGFRDPKAPTDQTGSLQLDDDVQYDDDFNSHRSDFSRSELSIGEEIEEVSIEGPDSSNKLDDSTQDLSVSQLSQSHGADYMEEVA
ncbi:FGFR1 oncogene partner [Pseudoliparis swirei]|uniref:FGFR1 oncogene partner n=1 Tax=Pseudoliparis swirei TaxID=2059687 RepID=UPI0024BDFD4E|nr:FGFR1 oncogene partner [Pseudoliparis swirei]